MSVGLSDRIMLLGTGIHFGDSSRPNIDLNVPLFRFDFLCLLPQNFQSQFNRLQMCAKP